MGKHSKHTWIVDVIEDGSVSIEVDGRTVTPIHSGCFRKACEKATCYPLHTTEGKESQSC